jgi:hypothetical protein
MLNLDHGATLGIMTSKNISKEMYLLFTIGVFEFSNV